MSQQTKSGPSIGLAFEQFETRDLAFCLSLRTSSQGITEGKVNKLKTLKRIMYGRAGFALLRQRLLHDA